MANVLMLAPIAIADASGTGGGQFANLLTPDPKEAWFDDAIGLREIRLDLGFPTTIDTLFLGYVGNALAQTDWMITGGIGGYLEDLPVMARTALRVPDSPGLVKNQSHALWHGSPAYVRYVRVQIWNDDATYSRPLSIGVAIAGRAFVPEFNKEFGAGRGVKDTGSVTRLPSGSIAAVEGARVGTYGWTFGDLDQGEADRLYDLQKDVGETRRVLVVEDPAPTSGLYQRVHYGMLTGLKKYERRNAAQVRWDFAMEEWT